MNKNIIIRLLVVICLAVAGCFAATAATGSVSPKRANTRSAMPKAPVSITDLCEHTADGWQVYENVGNRVLNSLQMDLIDRRRNDMEQADGSWCMTEVVTFQKRGFTIDVEKPVDRFDHRIFVHITFPAQHLLDAFIATAKAKGAKYDEAAGAYLLSGNHSISINVDGLKATVGPR